ncbi:MAG: sigma-70 family RNA polymerase sigma factor, partial [Candidatus Poribacteria bacterium]|nr:sigma-70 family RNA polymerase sigma factor [Candidatus Poribacteria bacterium]
SVSLSSQLVSPDESADQTAIRREMGNILRAALDALPEREHRVLLWRYGIDSETYTLDAIGSKLGISRERVRQLEQQALKRIRCSEATAVLSAC